MHTNRIFVLLFGVGTLISGLLIIRYTFLQEEEKVKFSEKPPAFVENKNGILKKFRDDEIKYIPFFYQSYIKITHEYKDYLNGSQNAVQLETELIRFSNVFETQFNKIEDNRLSYRYKLSEEELSSKEFNDLYHYSFQPRWRLKDFIDFFKDNENRQDRNIKAIYKDNIINGFEKEFPILLDNLEIKREEYPIITQLLNREQYNKKEISNKLKNDIALKLMSQSWYIKDIQIVGNHNYSNFVAIKLAVEDGDEQFLVHLSKKIYQELFTLYPQITYLSINLETHKGDLLMTGLGIEVFSQSTDLKRVADLYNYIKNNNPDN